jgi:asparagine synthase (glutamine-hydrolysing)
MVAFAVWDERTGELWLARDTVGIKPLYYRVESGGIAFASELRALVGTDATIDPGSLRRFVLHGYVPGAQTILQGVRRVPPGHVLRWQAGTVTVRSFHEEQPPVELDPGSSEEQLVDRLEACLAEAVEAHMVADVPIGAFLSGGIDSGIVVALMARLTRRTIKTFTIACPEDPDDEAALARLRATWLGTEHSELAISSVDLAGLVPDAMQSLDEPLGDYSYLPTFAVARFAAASVKVVLSGDGGDELFCGYRRYRAVRVAQMLEGLPTPVRRLVASVLGRLPHRRSRVLSRILMPGHFEERYRTVFGHVDAAAADRLLRQGPGGRDELFARTFHDAPGACLVEQVMALDEATYLVDDVLLKVDRGSMASGLEVRPPLLDRQVRAFARALPFSWKLRGLQGKYLLRRVLDRHLPRSLYERKKRGFSVPMSAWLRGALRGPMERLLDRERVESGGLFDPLAVRQLLTEHLQRSHDHGNILWSLVSFELWRERFGIRPAARDPQVVLLPAPRRERVPGEVEAAR